MTACTNTSISRIRRLHLVLFAAVLALWAGPGDAQISVSLPEISGGVGEKVRIPVETGILDGQGVFAFTLTIAYDPDRLKITGASVEGTVADSATVVVNAETSGQVRIVASRETEFAGSGTLVILEGEYLGGGAVDLQWSDFAFDGTAAPAPALDPGVATIEGEVVVNRLVNGSAPDGDIIELLVLEDGLDLRGYQVQDFGAGGSPENSFAFADDPLWSELRRGTVIAVGGTGAGLEQDLDLADGRIAVVHDAGSPNPLMAGGGFALSADADALQLQRPDGAHAFAVTWGGGGAFAGRHVDLGDAGVPEGTSLAFIGGSAAGMVSGDQWEVQAAPADLSLSGNSPENAAWIAAQRTSATEVLTLALPTQVELPVGQRVRLPVLAGDLTGKGVFSYLLSFTYDAELIEIRQVRTAGTLSDSASVLVNDSVSGEITVVGSQAVPLEGEGALLELEVQLLARGVAGLEWVEASFNEGEPAVRTVDGALQLQVGSGEDVAVGFGQVEGQVGEKGLLPVTVDDLSGQNVFGYAFTFTFDPDVLKIAGTSVEGTVSEGREAFVNEIRPGVAAVSAAGEAALQGGGILLNLEVESVGHGSSPLVWESFLFDEGGVGATTANGSLPARGEVLVNEVGNEMDTGGDWIELVVIEDGLDLRGYEVRDPGGEGFVLADDPRWTGLRRGTVVVVGGNASGIAETVEPERFRMAVRQENPLVAGLIPDLDGDADAVQVLSPEGELVFEAGWGSAGGTGEGLRLEFGTGPVAAGSSLAYLEGGARGTIDPLNWGVRLLDPLAAGTGNSSANRTWIEELRLGTGGALTVTLPQGIAGQVGDAVRLPVKVGELTGKQVFSYGFTLAYDPELIAVRDVSAGGAISEGMTLVANTGTPGQVSVFASGIEALEGAGTLLFLDVEYLDRGPAELQWTEFAFDEGEWPVALVDGLIGLQAGIAGGVQVRLPQVVAQQGTSERLAIEVDDLTGLGVFSYEFTVLYDASIMTVSQVIQEGTVSQGMQVQANLEEPGKLTVAASQEAALEGDGALLELEVEYAGGGIGELRWQRFAFDEGVLATLVDGRLQVGGVTTAGDDTVATTEDAAVEIAVLENDFDPEGEPLRITAVSQPASGAVEISPDSTSVTYTPDGNFNGEDGFTYSISDGASGAATGAVVVTVTPVNDPPVAVDDSGMTDEDVPVVLDLLANDSDVDGEQPSLDSVGLPQHGTAEIDADGGTVTYTPEAGFSGEDSFTYAIVDGSGASGAAAVNVTVNAEQIPPALASSRPADGETGLDPEQLNADGLVFVFSEPIAAAGVQVAVQGDGQTLDWTGSWSAGDTQLTLLPEAGSELVPGGVYEIALTQVLDLKGNDAGTIAISFETQAALAGDVNADGVVDVRDAILTLRLAAGLPVSTPPAGHVEPTPYERRAADVDGNGAVDEADALLTLGTALERIATKPALAQSGPAVLRWGEMAEADGELIVPVLVGGSGDPHAGRVDLQYGTEALELLEVSAGNAGGLLAVDERTAGELGVSLVHLDGLAGSGGAVLRLRFRVRESLRDEGWMRLEGSRLFDAGAGRLEVEREETILRLVPRTHALFQNAPNPFNPSTEIRFQLAESGAVRLVVYDLLGRSVRVLVDGHREAGHHRVTWDGRDEVGRPAGSGMYLLRLESGDFAQVRKMTLMR